MGGGREKGGRGGCGDISWQLSQTNDKYMPQSKASEQFNPLYQRWSKRKKKRKKKTHYRLNLPYEHGCRRVNADQ